jgi:hypothetical protein
MSIFLGDRPVSVFFNGASASLPVQGVFLGGIQVFPTGAGGTVPGVPGIDGASAQNGTTAVILFPGTDEGSSPITSYEFTFDGVPVVPDTADLESLAFTFTGNFAGQDVRVRAVNAVGAGPFSDPAVVG